MKKLLRIFFITALTVGIISNADAQRTRESREGSRPSVSRESSRNTSPSVRSAIRRDAPSRTFQNSNRGNTVNRAESNRPTESITRNQQRNPVVSGPSTQRMTASRGGYTMRGGRTGIPNNSYRYTHTYRTNPSYRHYDNRYYGNVYGRRTAFMYGPRYKVIPRTFISIHFGGHPYYYNSGYFYGYYGGYYQPIFPPFGLRINVLPFGYTRIYFGGYPFYYYNGIYYRQYDSYYQVVDAPMGAVVSSLPEGARTVVINGETLYELNGTFYRADTDPNGSIVYTVIGKNGVVNNSQDINDGSMQYPGAMQPAVPLQEGDIISQLPEGSKVVTINGTQLYETPDNIYLQQESNNGVIGYKVVGK